MKKSKVTRSLLAACSIVALTAVMYGCVHNGGGSTAVVEPEPMPEPMPEPDPEPTDLEDTQAAAAMAAADAKTASDAAAASSMSAAEATATLATLQTGADSNLLEMGGNEHADAAASYAKKAAASAAAAADASAAAAAATTGPEGEAAWRMAENAKDAAEAAMASADTHAKAAIAAAKMELHIDGAMKWVDIVDADGTVTGMSSVNANMGNLTSADGKVSTGFQAGIVREDVGMVPGKAFVHGENRALDQAYVQTVEGRDITIGKTLDTTNDMARLTLVTGRVGSNAYRVFADDGDPAAAAPVAADGKVDHDADAATASVTLKPLGMFIEATVAGTPPSDAVDVAGDRLDYSDIVHAKLGADDAARALATAKDNKPVMVYSYVSGDPATTTYVVEVERVVNAVTGTTSIVLQPVDITALSAPDLTRDTGTADAHEQAGVTANIPTVKEYKHIHFGVWNNLAGASAAQTIGDLGIGFVQNIGQGVTQKQGIGSVSYNGDWVAAVRRQYASDAEAGAIKVFSDSAELTANFDKSTFKGVLANLATLEGSLTGNGFSGATAALITHDDLDSSGTFVGSFSGNIYGAKGEEAAGVFDFDGGEAGGFVGAFGGTNQD